MRDEDTVQKNRQHTDTSTTRKQVVMSPEVVSIDVLCTLLDEDLVDRLRALDDDRNRAYDVGASTRPWEEEIAYVRREQQMRKVRRDNHADYVLKEQRLFEMAEYGLPPGDFDNSEFVYAATGGRPRWN